MDAKYYHKYSKFAFITKQIKPNNVNGTSSAASHTTLLMSGLDWVSPSLKLNSSYTGNRTFLIHHTGTISAIGLVDGATNNDLIKETFIDNIFYKPASPIVELSMTFNSILTLGLIAVSAPIEPFHFIFQIVPVE